VHFETLTVGELETNCYLISESPPDAIVIDAGGSADEIIAHLEAAGLAPTTLVATHGHADHIIANAALRERYVGMRIAIGRLDAEMLSSPAQNMSLVIGRQVKSPPADRLLEEGDLVEVGGVCLRVIHTPGHSPGSISLCAEDFGGAPAVFAGDTLFAGSVGRCDIPGGSWSELLAAIREKIYALPDETRVFPGHGPPTTVGHEKRTNPFVGAGG
jgi:glyoxylase-like metal-dependent hydrolase (beta-lactamase superfamily II)